ncbi:MAG: DNA repair protein RecO [Methylococcaceae bacterium]|nr:DNA repair protein RecO [Methylococcaceae bacterium]
MSPAFSLHDGFLLHRRHYRETSLLVDVFTREFGLSRLIAKGALRSKTGSSGVLQPFLPLSLGWTGRSELQVLTGAENRGRLFQLAGKPLFCGFYLNELLLRLLPPHDPHPRVFQFYEESLHGLETGQCLDQTLRGFELALLNEIGYGPVLDQDVESGREIRREGFYHYHIDRGPVESGPIEGAIRGSTLLGLSHGHLPGPEEIHEAKQLMRRLIHRQLGGKPLNSRKLFKYQTNH